MSIDAVAVTCAAPNLNQGLRRISTGVSYTAEQFHAPVAAGLVLMGVAQRRPDQLWSSESIQSYARCAPAWMALGGLHTLPTAITLATVKPPGGSACVRIVRLVITPHVLPPPPRSAHHRSAWLERVAVATVPLASTTSAATMLSVPSPAEGPKGPCPPPVLQPVMPTVMAHPDATWRPRSLVRSCSSENTWPVPTTMVSLSSPHANAFSSAVRMNSDASHECRCRKSCPVPATLTHRRCLAANRTAACTCAVVSGNTVNAGVGPVGWPGGVPGGLLRTDALQYSGLCAGSHGTYMCW